MLAVPVPFEKRKSGRGVWGEFRFSFAKSNCGQPRHLPEYLEGRTPQKNTLFIKRRKNRRVQIKNCEENFFAGLRGFRATAGLASLLGVLLKKCSNFVQKTPPFYNFSVSIRRSSASRAKQFSIPFKRKRACEKYKKLTENCFVLIFGLTPKRRKRWAGLKLKIGIFVKKGSDFVKEVPPILTFFEIVRNSLRAKRRDF